MALETRNRWQRRRVPKPLPVSRSRPRSRIFKSSPLHRKKRFHRWPLPFSIPLALGKRPPPIPASFYSLPLASRKTRKLEKSSPPPTFTPSSDRNRHRPPQRQALRTQPNLSFLSPRTERDKIPPPAPKSPTACCRTPREKLLVK